MVLAWPTKDPNEVLDYVVDWSDRLGEDIISTSEWTVPDDITQDSDSKTDTTTTIWLSGGTVGTTYTFINRITTTGGRTMDQSVKLKLKEK